MPKISIKPEKIFEILGFNFTNSFITSSIVIFLFFIIAVLYQRQLNKKDKSYLFYFINFSVNSIYSFFKSVMGDKIEIFFPLLGTFFFYILLQNWFGLLPGVGSLLIKVEEHGEKILVPLFRGSNADLNTTLMLGLVSVILIQYYGIKFVGFKDYIKKFINFKSPVDFYVGVLETVSEVSKVVSFSFRLFGNIFAGEVLLTIVAFLVPILVTFPFLLLEIFVGLIQAMVFPMLTAVFINSAIQKHH